MCRRVARNKPVTGAVIDLQFTDAAGKNAVLTMIAGGKTIDSRLDAEPGFAVTQRADPCGEGFGLPDLDHGWTVRPGRTAVNYG